MRNWMNLFENSDPQTPLYHGTCIEFLCDILKSNTLKATNVDRGPIGVSMTTSFAVGERFTTNSMNGLIKSLSKKTYDLPASGSLIVGAVIELNEQKIIDAGYEFVHYASRINKKEAERRVAGDIAPVVPLISQIHLIQSARFGLLSAPRPFSIDAVIATMREIAAKPHERHVDLLVYDWSPLMDPKGSYWGERADILEQHKSLFR